MAIKIAKVFVKGEFDTEIIVPDLEKLEECRVALAEAYGNGHMFEISFTIHTDNFENLKYPEMKKRTIK